jgi:hypothetical protein
MLNICSGSISSQLTEVLFAGLREACNPVNKLAVEAINVIFNTYEKLERLFVEQGSLKNTAFDELFRRIRGVTSKIQFEKAVKEELCKLELGKELNHLFVR